MWYIVFRLMVNNRKKRQKATTTRTVRLSEYLDDLLEKDSEDKRISINSLVTSIITRYAEWDRYTEKIGFISLPRSSKINDRFNR